MAGELHSVRSKFVDKVTKPVIKQLLDDILEDGIINDGEKESIAEEIPSRADQARALIDTVKKKGDNASWKFIAHIKRRDGTLYSEVGLSSGQPAPALAAEPQMKMQRSAAFAKDQVANKDEEIYPVTEYSLSKRVALLITNMKFANAKFNRNGAEKDEKNMEKLLTNLRYEVVKHTNLTGKAIDDAVINFSKHPKLKETDSVLVVIMSHGKLGAVLGVETSDDDDDEFPINNIYKHLGSENCPALLDKPKIIIIQACRGVGKGSVIVCDSANSAVLCDDVKQPSPHLPADDDIEEDVLRCVHREKDFISLLSSTPDAVSYRHRDEGSFLIQYIAEIFPQSALADDIEELFRKVMKRFEGLTFRTIRQMPTKDRCTLTKRFYFFPGS
uniref:Caspase 1 n=1 Tax=Miichthys miiuy TaxID=240162 RepID=W0K5I2_MIIMI|nr:caspase 1 [Miichthys miiuy]